MPIRKDRFAFRSQRSFRILFAERKPPHVHHDKKRLNCKLLGAASLACLSGVGLTACRSQVAPVRLLASPTAPHAVKPVFLDAANQIMVGLDQPATAASLLGHVSVHCGNEIIPVTRVDAVSDQGQGQNSGKPDSGKEVVLAGTFQSALGGSNWVTGDSRTRMTAVAPGVYTLQTRLPKGSYEYKVTRGGSFEENYGADFKPGGANISLVVPADNTLVLFKVDFNAHTIQTSLDAPGLTSSAAPAQEASSRVLRLTLSRKLSPTDIVRPLTLQLPDGTSRPIFARDILSEPEYTYGGSDLGASYTRAATTFKVWSPVSTAAELLLYKDAASNVSRQVPLHHGAAGVWTASVPGDLNGVYYQYRFTSYGRQRDAPDIYGRAASVDMRRTMVVDLARTNPEGFGTVPSPKLAQPTEAVVYEVHTRDFTIDPSSGVPPALRGTYLGLVTPGTKVPGTDRPTGIDYLRRLGITHLHVLPFQGIAPDNSKGYNWGYETELFNVPEPRYATRPNDPASVIREVKTMVTGLHRAHLGLVMDVVYNHTVPVSGDASPFSAAVPYYYIRTGPQGEPLDESGVGNALDDDHPMVRKYICDSLAYWETQYHVDGFRFDLLGMFTPQTVRAISDTLHRLRPDILLYGEPWTGGGPTRFGKGAQRGLKVAVFNDNIRNLIRGDLNGTKAGFALGGGADAAALQSAVSGSPDFTSAPTESMNYVSIHDDMTLFDKITKTLPSDDTLDRQALKLAGAMVILSQGVPILEGGAELGRTKQGQSNSYNLGDAVNHFDWARGRQFADVSDYYRGLIAIRRSHAAFRNATAASVRETVSFLPAASLPAKTAAFTLDGAPSGDPWRKTLVVFHGATTTDTLTLPPGQWRLAANRDHAGTQGAAQPDSTLSLAPLSAFVLYQDTAAQTASLPTASVPTASVKGR